MFEYGVMQTAEGWASVTGRGGIRQGGEQTMTLTVDRDSVFLTTESGMKLKYPFRRSP